MAKPIVLQDSTGKRKRASLILLDTGFTLDENEFGDPIIGGGGAGGGGSSGSILVQATAAADFAVAGDAVEIPIDADYTLVEAEILADSSGDAVVTVELATTFPTFTSITGATPPTLASQQRVTDTTLTGWTTELPEGSVLRLTLSSVSGPAQVTVGLKLVRDISLAISAYRKVTIVRTLTLAGQVEDIPIDQDGTIVQAQLILDTTGSAGVETSLATSAAYPTFSRIDGGTATTVSSAQRVVDTTLTGWAPTVSAGDTVRYRLSSFGGGLARATMALTLEVGTVVGGGGFGGTLAVGVIPAVTGAQTLGASGLTTDGATVSSVRPLALGAGLVTPVTAVSSSLALNDTHHTLHVTANATLTLPDAAVHMGRTYHLLVDSGVTATLSPSGTDTADDATFTGSGVVQSDGSNWATVAKAAGGGGGGGGALWWFSPPLAATFSLASGDATNLTLTDDADAGLLVDGGTPVTGDKSRLAYRTLTTKTLNWDLKVRSDYFVPQQNFSGVGIACRDSISGRVISITMRGSSPWLCVNKWNGLTGFNATAASVIPVFGAPINWFRIAKSGTTLSFYWSTDGKQWLSLYSETATTFLTNNADQVGIVIDHNRSTGPHNTQAIGYFSLTGTGV